MVWREAIIMTFIIDRFEGEFAVVEMGGNIYNIPKVLLPEKFILFHFMDDLLKKNKNEFLILPHLERKKL